MNLDKLREFESDCVNNSNTSVTMNHFYKTRDTPIVVGVFLDFFIHFVVMNGSSLNIALLTRFKTDIVAIDQLLLNLAVALAICYRVQVIHNDVVYFVDRFRFFYFVFV